ncbi:MAG: hypothetical protein Kow0025_25020 [Thermodesulfovibrionales bacterium]
MRPRAPRRKTARRPGAGRGKGPALTALAGALLGCLAPLTAWAAALHGAGALAALSPRLSGEALLLALAATCLGVFYGGAREPRRLGKNKGGEFTESVEEDAERAARDISQQRAEIEEQTEFLNSILESILTPLYVIDAEDYSVRVANPAGRAAGAASGGT